ncbi:hypothetical protein V2J09_014729 [Rumex salicifolius]
MAAVAGNDLPEKPTILLHRPSSFRLSFADRLSHQFNLLDPVPSSATELRRLLGPRAADIRLVLSAGPAPLDADYLACLPSLECVVVTAAGVDLVDLAECRRRGITVANNGGAFSEDVADYAVGLLIDVLRKISTRNRFVRAKSWPAIGDFYLGSKIKGKRVGIIGLGSIGKLVAKRLDAFGCKVSYNSRNKKPSFPYPYYDNILNLASESDVLVLCCSLTDQTRHIVERGVMSALGARGVIINVGRGALIDEKVMVRLLVEGQLGGAGLDVFENEPDVARELFGLDNVVLSPHNAVCTPESFKAAADVVMANLEAFFANKPLVSPVSLE